ncbi:disease resistance protein RUN1-like isoform X2 [Eucalyptus grandis]|uniref:disease resistance protein RUN1-like isoform X2 n=1 Tax=Eucalyptus grandis TaxID=71139 RepID=UPI00192E8984|nr:disease resistance protein RUN1-like isoform X2 [Eucalyptus grandis]
MCDIVVRGIVGIGKATLAKAVVHKIAHKYDACSFLSNIRERSQTGDIVKLQKQLLSDILKSTTDLHNVNDGLNMINSRLRGKKVLILLDDVDNVQLRALAKIPHWFGLGSWILMTTRDVSLLPVEATARQDLPFKGCLYEMRGLNFGHALQLFSKHAFGETLPPDDRENLSREIVATTGGNPLALEVLGSFLRTTRVRTWVATLERLRRSPHERVQEEVLSISYEAISFEQRQIYLDIACFFNGHERRLPEYMWKDCGFFPESGLPALTDMSLLKINHDRFSMHEQLVAFGREIVRKENHLNAGNRSRLWESEECLCILREPVDYQRTRNVELLRLQLPRVQTLRSQEFAALPKLRFLHVEGAKFTGDYKMFSEN